jgi:hypothetical protein
MLVTTVDPAIWSVALTFAISQEPYLLASALYKNASYTHQDTKTRSLPSPLSKYTGVADTAGY